MEREPRRDEVVSETEETIRDGDVVIEERMNRREGLVEYEGTVDARASGAAGGGRGFPTDDLSMSTDNTPEGRLMSDTIESGPITLVRNGMTVVDASGANLGKVDFVKMGDPGAVTTRGQEIGREGLLDDLGRALFGGRNLPEVIRNDLLRLGFIHIDGRGWIDTDRYAAADQIAGVAGDTVTLSVDKEALPVG